MASGAEEPIIRTWSEDRLALLPDGRELPTFDAILADAVNDRVWVRDFLPEWKSDEAREWTIYDATGGVVARVRTPSGLQVMHVGMNHVVGVERDELGVEYVVVYAIE